MKRNRNCTKKESPSKMDHKLNETPLQIEDLKLQLEGSNNLVNKMETEVFELKKERDVTLKINAELQLEMQETKKDLNSVVNHLKKKVDSLHENLLSLQAEKKNVSCLLDSEKNRSQKLESDMEVHKKHILNLEAEMKKNENYMMTLKTEWNLLKFHYSEFFKAWEKTDILELENESSQVLTDKEKNVKINYLKSNLACLEEKLKNLNFLLLEPNQADESSFQINFEELYKCNNKYQELLCQYKKMKKNCSEKKKEITNYIKIMKEKNSLCESLEIKCKEYEIEIKKLKSINCNLQADIKEINQEKAMLLTSHNLANDRIENCEKALQEIKGNFHQKMLKQSEKLNKEINLLKLETEEKEAITLKYSAVDAFQSDTKNSEREFAELKYENLKLQNEIACLKKESEILVHEKNLCITEKNTTITHLKEQISKIDEEKNKSESELVKFKANLRNKLGEKNISDYAVSNLNIAGQEKHDLANKMENSFENESLKTLQNTKNEKIKNETFISDTLLEDQTCEQSNLGKWNKDLQGKIAPEELNKVDQIQDNINNENLKKEISYLKKELSLKEKSNLEKSLLNQQLQKRVNETKKEISQCTESTKKKIDELAYENNSLKTELQILKTQSKSNCLCKVNSGLSDSVKSKNCSEFATKLLGLLINCIENSQYTDYSENKIKLLALVTKWKENIADIPQEMYNELAEFLEVQLGKEQIIESKISCLSKSIFYFSSTVCQFCETANIKPLDNDFVAGDNPFMDCNFSYETVSNIGLGKIIEKMQECLKMLELYVASMKNNITKNAVDIKTLKENIDALKIKIYEESLDKRTEMPGVK